MDANRVSVWAGLTMLVCFVVGIVGFLAGLLAVFNEYDYVGAGLCFTASALALGLLANAMLRS